MKTLLRNTLRATVVALALPLGLAACGHAARPSCSEAGVKQTLRVIIIKHYFGTNTYSNLTKSGQRLYTQLRHAPIADTVTLSRTSHIASCQATANLAGHIRRFSYTVEHTDSGDLYVTEQDGLFHS